MARAFQPARRTQRRREEGTSLWQLDYRRQENIRKLDGTTLDKPFLLESHCVDEPSLLCFVDIRGQKLGSLKPEDLKEFKNVAYVNASLNSLSLGPFSCFVALRELNLTLNGICSLAFDGADFPHLRVLDLSYNRVPAEDAASLGQLPRLKTLHLTGNQLHGLPLSFCSSHTDQLSSEEGAHQFEVLEVLMLDNNRLSSEVFYSLTNLKRLKTLNLQGNRISEIPQLQLRDVSEPGQLPAAEREDEAHTESRTDIHERLKILKTFHTSSWEKDLKGFSLPLPELQHLNLADNKITAEEALIGAAFFLKLCELDIHSNPLVTDRTGRSPFLIYLQKRLGITIKERKTQGVERIHLKVSTDSKKKERKHIPKVTKSPFLKDDICQKKIQESTDQISARPKDKNTSKVHKNTQSFFITQAEEEPKSDFVFSSEAKETAESRRRSRSISEECYRRILDTETNPDVLNKPVGIQTAVQMLEHTLRNLNVYRDSRPRLDSIQTPYRQSGKRIKELPPLRPLKRPGPRVDELMKEMKESKTIKVVPLGRALRSKDGYRADYKEAQSLLRDLMVKHKMVHEKAFEHNYPNATDRPPQQEF
uniref:X-ray radiation resistance associated 1 n=1 Tax=Nothobranchius furzeri TaxID=105023 RepID=A0A1A8UW90_NOTFU